jgi:hypothetical protein
MTTDIVERLCVILDKYERRYKRVGWRPVVVDAIHEIRRLRGALNRPEVSQTALDALRGTGLEHDLTKGHSSHG